MGNAREYPVMSGSPRKLSTIVSGSLSTKPSLRYSLVLIGMSVMVVRMLLLGFSLRMCASLLSMLLMALVVMTCVLVWSWTATVRPTRSMQVSYTRVCVKSSISPHYNASSSLQTRGKEREGLHPFSASKSDMIDMSNRSPSFSETDHENPFRIRKQDPMSRVSQIRFGPDAQVPQTSVSTP